MVNRPDSRTRTEICPDNRDWQGKDKNAREHRGDTDDLSRCSCREPGERKGGGKGRT